MCVCVCVCFFFKQKTAYEMRISDWSSDVCSSDLTAEHGFAALRELDSNQDGVIDSQDAAFSELKIWRDANDNGRTDIGELLSLSEAGIASLQTQWSESTFIDSNGQAHRQTGSVTRLDGSSAAASDVWFSVDAGFRVNGQDVAVSNEIVRLPNVRAFGDLMDLRQAMALDPVLKGLVESFIATEYPIERAEIGRAHV